MSSIPLPKPAAARTLKTKYAELAATTSGRIDVSTEKGKEISELLHRFFAACSNLYGTIQLRGGMGHFLRAGAGIQECNPLEGFSCVQRYTARRGSSLLCT